MTSAPREFEVRYTGRGDRPHELEPVQIVADALLWLGPTTNPSSDIEILRRSLDMIYRTF
ncbi:MAG TPA: hypothetical protein VM715_18830 [Candidatus Acidoferrum sp.]|nr:hypothetical protein [Candidatus Acidoferrum sp.]